MDAAIGRGAALLRARRRDEAVASFRDALALFPDHPLAHLGLAVAGHAGFEPVESALTILDRTKPIEAALVRAQVLAVQGHGTEASGLLAGAIRRRAAGIRRLVDPASSRFCK